MGRRPCCSKVGLNKGAWTAAEDKILTAYIKAHGEGNWRNLPFHAGLKRCGKSCRLRWLNYLRPDIKRGNISLDEEELIIRLHRLLGNRWSLIAGRLPGRTDNEIKNYWNTTLAKKLADHQSQPSNSPLTPRKSKSRSKKLVVSNSDSSPASTSAKVQVIRTKATRFTRSVVINQPDHHSYDDHQTYFTNHPQESDIIINSNINYQEPDHETYSNAQDLNFTNFGCDDDQYDFMRSFGVGDPTGKSVPSSGESTVKDRDEDRFVEDMSTGYLDLDSLSFFLDSEEDWPLAMTRDNL